MKSSYDEVLEINLDLVDVNDHYPSLKYAINLQVGEHRKTLSLRIEPWFEQSAWDRFVRALEDIDSSIFYEENHFQIEISDMSEYFKIVLEKGDRPLMIKIMYSTYNCNWENRMEFQMKANSETLDTIKKAFLKK